MQIVIDIPERIHYGIEKGITVNGSEASQILIDAVKNGTPLPKGHGKLKDADELEEVFGEKCIGDCGCCSPKRKTDGRGKFYDTCYLIDEVPTIIEADKEKENE